MISQRPKEPPYESTGRSRQKVRTRDALIAAARALLAEQGSTPTVEQVAKRASVSRATAYRYFPHQRALVAATYPELELPSLVDRGASGEGERDQNPEARLADLAQRFTRQIVEHEPELRAMLRLSLEIGPGKPEELAFRKGRRIAWIADALSPLRLQMPEPELRRLCDAVGAMLGIEALVWLTDMAGHSSEEAAEVMAWAARSILHSALKPASG